MLSPSKLIGGIRWYSEGTIYDCGTERLRIYHATHIDKGTISPSQPSIETAFLSKTHSGWDAHIDHHRTNAWVEHGHSY